MQSATQFADLQGNIIHQEALKMLKKFSSKIKAFAFASVLASSLFTVPAVSAAEEENSEKLVTPYSDLWKGNISVKVGEPVKWYVDIPEDVTPKGCGATIKIPGLGWGTDTHNKEEGHLTLKQGENFVYEFTPSETGDILFTCWMGSGCHHNYIHVTEDGTYNAEAGAPDALDGQKAAAAPEVTATSAETTTAAVTESPTETTSETAPAEVTTVAEETTVATTTEAAEHQTTTSQPVTSAQVTTSKPGNVKSTPKTGSSAPKAAVIFMITSLGAAFITKKKHR